jgi:small subunit ribosomal protein S1
MAYGIEGFAPMKHLKKEDGSKAKVEDVIDFAILEFSKDDKKILISHTRTWDDSMKEEEKAPRKPANKGGGDASKSIKNLNQQTEKTTLGDLGVLSDLKKEMEQNQKSGKE